MTAPNYCEPPGRAIAELARPFNSLPLRSLWLATIPLFHVDAPVRVRRRLHLGRLALGVLNALSPTAPLEVDDLDRRLGLGRTLIHRVLAELETSGLVCRSSPAVYTRSPAASSTLANEPVECVTRGQFHFVQRPPPLSPHFLRLEGGALRVLNDAPPGNAKFDPRWLFDCFSLPDDWKARHHFPSNWTPAEKIDDPLAQFIVVRPEELEMVLAEADEWLGYDAAATRSADQRPAEILRLGPAVFAETFAGVWRPPDANDWQHAWRSWRLERGITDSESSACRVLPQGLSLTITAPDSLQPRLQQHFDDVECWLTVGSGAFRQLARLTFHFLPAGK